MKHGKTLVLILLLLGGVLLLTSFWDIIMEFFTAALIAYLLSPLAKLLGKKLHLHRGVAVALVLLLAVAILGFLLYLLVPAAIEEVTKLVDDIVRYASASNYDELLKSINEYLESLRLPPGVLDLANDYLQKADEVLVGLFSSFLTWAVNFTLSIVDVIVVIIIIIYLMLDGSKLMRSFLGILPHSLARRASHVLAEGNELVWKYVKVRVLVSGGMATVTYIGLSIIGVPYAALFAALSFVLDFIPYFGSTIAGIVEAVVATITGGIDLGITVAVFVLVVQQIEGNIVIPKVEGNATGLHPVTVMFSLLACNRIWGPMGMLISTPVAAVIKIIVKEMYNYIIDGEEPTVNQVVAHQEEQMVEESTQIR